MWRGCAKDSAEGMDPLYLVLSVSPENLRISLKESEEREYKEDEWEAFCLALCW